MFYLNVQNGFERLLIKGLLELDNIMSRSNDLIISWFAHSVLVCSGEQINKLEWAKKNESEQTWKKGLGQNPRCTLRRYIRFF